MFRIRWLDRRRVRVPEEYKELAGIEFDYFEMSNVEQVTLSESEDKRYCRYKIRTSIMFYIVPAYLFPPEDRAILDSLRPKWNR